MKTPSTKNKDITMSQEDSHALDKFSKELSDLLKKHDIKEYAGIFIVKGKPVISYFPDDVVATKLLKNAHTTCRNNVMERIGERAGS
jgi:hypothetical protein